MARIFTLDEARATLPLVKQLMERAQRARRELIRLRPDLVPTLQKATLNGGSRESGEAMLFYQELERGIKGIQELGIEIKDVDMGLVDFHGTRAGREIYLCWRYGEEEIAYWHDLDAGLAGRQPIDGLVD